MISGFLAGAITAFILKLFGINVIFLELIQPFFDTITLTDSHYYIIFGVIGAIGSAFSSSITNN